jgi:UDP-glucose 4-epimerase
MSEFSAIELKALEHKTILITGANGFIGRHLVARLSKIVGVKLLLLSRELQLSSKINAIWFCGNLSQLSAEYWAGFNISQIDYVFHLGGFIPKKSSDANTIQNAVDDNILGTQKLLQSLPGKLIKIIFSSTVDVYSASQGETPLSENSETIPATLYGSSKLFCEKLIAIWAREHDCSYAILRYGHIYGPGEEKYAKLIPIIIRNLLANQPPSIQGDGSSLRDYLYVADAIEATIRASILEKSIGPVNIVKGSSKTLKEIVSTLQCILQSDQQINFMLNLPNGNSLRFDNTLMVNLLGNWEKSSLMQGLTAEVKAFK